MKGFNPNLKVISYTGDGSDILKNKLLFGGANHFIQKEAQLLREFEKVLIQELKELTT